MPANQSKHADTGDLVLHEDEPEDLFALAPRESLPWRILIVDDDVDVHVVTKFALSNTNFQGRRLSFLHAYSAAEAYAIVRDTPDIAMLLLDVIMETPDAGLALARKVRAELHNHLIRIVLRTGQPGQALEHSIIVDYDINDFWCKADLTTRKLFTTVITSLRVYAALSAAAAQRKALAAELTRARQLCAVLDQHALVLTLDTGGRIADVNDKLCQLAGKARAQLLGQDMHALHPAPFPQLIVSDMMSALAQIGTWAGDVHTAAPDGAALVLRCTALSFNNTEGAPVRYVAVATRLDSG